ncbi:hypothetical protein [Nocardia sp. NPDC049707]|uniref:hypothetical protein n=1 Tax=Nocardia sp. NPDC049707 TaxID=3154735 RepID=UPI003448523C
MSGGSYNYLYSRDLIEVGVQSDLEAARDRLAGLGYADDVAQKVQGILDAIAEVERRRDEIADVLQALEWWDSNDFDEEGFREQLDLFQERQQS